MKSNYFIYKDIARKIRFNLLNLSMSSYIHLAFYLFRYEEKQANYLRVTNIFYVQLCKYVIKYNV